MTLVKKPLALVLLAVAAVAVAAVAVPASGQTALNPTVKGCHARRALCLQSVPTA